MMLIKRCTSCAAFGWALLVHSAAYAQTTGPVGEPGGRITAPAAIPAGLDRGAVSAFVKSFSDTFKDDLMTVGCNFTTGNGSEAVLLMHVRPRRDGFFVVHYDYDMQRPFPQPNLRRVSREFGITIGKPGTRRVLRHPLEMYPPGILADVGDTVLLPFVFPAAGTRYAFSTTSEPQAAGRGTLADSLARMQHEEIARWPELPRAFAHDAPVKNLAEPNLALLGADLESFSHASLGRATHSCDVLLEARQPGEFMLQAVVPSPPAGVESADSAAAIPLTIVAAGEPLTVLCSYFAYHEGPASGGRGVGGGHTDFLFRPDTPGIPNTIALRVGDRLIFRPWSVVVIFEERAGQPPPKVFPPPITLERRPRPQPASSTAPATTRPDVM